jgi:hypothetical protein
MPLKCHESVITLPAGDVNEKPHSGLEHPGGMPTSDGAYRAFWLSIHSRMPGAAGRAPLFRPHLARDLCTPDPERGL